VSYTVTAIRDVILATSGNFDDYVTGNGIIVSSTAGKSSGIVPRWFQVYEVGPEAPKEIKPEQWILVEHGRWSDALDVEDPRQAERSQTWRIDPKGIMGISDEKPDTGIAYNSKTAWT
jgi:hypothetical protein